MFRCHPASRASSSQKSRTRVPSGLVPAALLVESRVSVVAGVSGRGPGRLGCADCRRCSRLALFFGLEDLDCLVRTTCPAFLDALLLALLSVQPARSRIARNPSVVAAPKSARYLLGGGGVSRRFLVIALSPLVAPALCVTCRGCAAFPGVRVRGVQCRDCRGGPGGVQAATNRWTGTSSRSCCACRRRAFAAFMADRRYATRAGDRIATAAATSSPHCLRRPARGGWPFREKSRAGR